MKILVKFPSRGRPVQFFECLDRYINLAENIDEISFICTLDKVDYLMNNEQVIKRLDSYKNLHYFFGYSRTKIEAINADMPVVNDWDILLQISDDMIPQVKGWDSIIKTEMQKNFPDLDGVLHFNDGLQGQRLNTLVICGRKYYERFNFIYVPIYETMSCDDEFMDVSRKLGKQKYFNQVIIKHCHIGYGSNMDHTAKKNCYFDRDRKIYDQRRSINFGLNDLREISLFNECRLGDGIFTIQYLRRLSQQYINCKFNYYCKPEYFVELQEHIGIFKDRIFLHDIKNKPVNAVNCWIGENNYWQNHKNKSVLNKFYFYYFEKLSAKLNFSNPVNKDWVFEHELLNLRNYPNYDVLLINSQSLSGHSKVNEKEVNNFIEKYSEKYKIITTEKIDGIDCTRDLGISTLDIGNLSTIAKYIVAYNTAPIISCLNKFTLNNTKKIFIIDDHCSYSYSNVFHIKSISEAVLKEYASSDLFIAAATYNRKKTTEICLKNLVENKMNSRVVAIDDCSTEYDISFVNNICEAYGVSQHTGIHNIRFHFFNEFLKQGKEFLYMTDNDAMHDPDFINRLFYLFNKYKLPVSLYNSNMLEKSKQIHENEEAIFTGHCPGVSMFLNREMVKKVLKGNAVSIQKSWDWAVCDILREFVVSKISYVQHFGASGIHSKDGQDMAVNPTEYLIEQTKLMKGILW